MPPKKIIETNASSLIDLKALVAQQEAEFNRKRTDPSSQRSTTTTKKQKQQPKANRGVKDRAQRDVAASVDQETDLDAVEKSRQALERKARLYDSLQQRGGGHDDDDDDDNQLIDFEQKYQVQQRKRHDRFPPKKDDDDDDDDSNRDPWVEYEDEFGRTRVVRASAVPRSPSPASPASRSPPRRPLSDDDDYDDDDQADRANIRHYRASQDETRVQGVGHYQFATDDDDERQRQMASLLKLRQETQQARKQSRTASERRRAIVAKRAERIHQHWATLRRQQQDNTDSGTSNDINDDSVTQLLQTLRQQSGY